MSSRERVRVALAHRDPSRVPIDFGATTVTGIHVSSVEALREYYGLEKRPVKVLAPSGMLGVIDDDLMDAMGVDAVGLYPRSTSFGVPNEGWKEFRTPWGQVVLIAGRFEVTTDTNGDLLTYPQGDTSAPPSGRMPLEGYYFDTIIRQAPIDEDALDPADNLEEFGPLSAPDLQHFGSEVTRLQGTGGAVVASIGGTGFGDIAQVPAPGLSHPRGIRDITEWYVSLAIRQDYVRAVFERQCEIALGRLAQFHAVVGEAVDVLNLCGTDFGTQRAMLCSMDTFDKLWAPIYQRLNDWIHTHTTWKSMKHCCGAIGPLIPRFIDVGFDILNPLQFSAAGMDPRAIKEKYGDQLVLWGGGVNTQETLPFGTREAVRSEVLERCEILSKGGGYIFNAIHCIQANTPVENIVAMLDAVREFNGLR